MSTKQVLLPVTIGDCCNVSPVLLDESTWEYAVSDSAVAGIDLRLDNEPLSAASLQLAEGRFRLSSKPEGTLTADVQHAANTVPGAINWLCDRLGISQANYLHFDTFRSSSEVGLWLSGEDDYSAAFSRLCESVGAYWRFNRMGQLEVVGIQHDRDADYSITYDDIVNIQMTGELPELSECTVNYRKNYTVQADYDNYSTDSLQVSTVNADNNYPEKWRETESFESLLTQKTDALTRLNNLSAWRFNRRRSYQITALLRGVQLNPADRLHVYHPDWGLDATGTVMNVERMPGANRAVLEWTV